MTSSTAARRTPAWSIRALAGERNMCDLLKSLPAGHALRVSLLDGLTRPPFGPVTHFASHAWSLRFLDLAAVVLDARNLGLEDVASQYETVYVWLDIFAILQSVVDTPAVAREKSGDLAGLDAVIAASRTTVLAFSPFASPVCMTRSWCWFEIAGTLSKERGDLRLGLTPDGWADVGRIVTASAESTDKGPALRDYRLLLEGIDFNAATARFDADRDRIAAAIAATLGDRANSEMRMALSASLLWAADSAAGGSASLQGLDGTLDRIIDASGASVADQLRFRNRLVRVYYRQGHVGRAAQLCERLVASQRAMLDSESIPPGDSRSLGLADNVNSLGRLLCDLRDVGGAMAALEEALAIRTAVLGGGSSPVAETLYNAGRTLVLAQLEPSRAIDLIQRAVDIWAAQEPQPSALGAAFIFLARAHDNAGAGRAVSDDLFHRGVAVQRATLAEDHPNHGLTALDWAEHLMWHSAWGDAVDACAGCDHDSCQ